MKIGIATTQYANNYGALLQTYALQTYLNNMENVEAETISYFAENYMDSWRIYPRVKMWKDLVLNLMMRAFFVWTHEKKIRNNKNRNFRSSCIKLSRDYFSAEEIEKDSCPYDCLMCGSDQIWNAVCIGSLDPVFFLKLKGTWENVPKVAYAPSVADPIPPALLPQFQENIKDFTALSVREDRDAEMLSELAGREVCHVCDPVFLLDKKVWEDLAIMPDIQEPYICCYFLNPSDKAAEAVKMLKKKTGLKIVHVNINVLDKLWSDYDIRDAGVREFLGYIRGAEYVMTNSFHCTVFSSVFQKNFYVIGKPVANLRMESLLRTLGLSDRFLYDTEIHEKLQTLEPIDYTLPNQRMGAFKEQSEKYLDDALKGIEQHENSGK